MPTVVDALTVSLNLDVNDWVRGQEKARQDLRKMDGLAAEQGRTWDKVYAEHTKKLRTLSAESTITAKTLQAEGARAASFYSQIKTAALGLIGVLLGGRGIAAFTSDAVRQLSALGREAHNIGIATPELAAFRMAIERNGGSAEAATQSFRNLVDVMEQWKVLGRIDPTMLNSMNAIGAQRTDAALDVFKKFSAYADAHRNDAPLINLVGKGLGFDQGTINEAMKGIVQVNKDLAESYKLGVPNDDMIKRMQQMQHDWIALEQAAENLGNTILAKLQPSLTGFLNWMNEVIRTEPQVAVGLAVVGGWLVTIAGLNFGAVMAFLGRLLPLASLLAAVGPAGGEDPEFSKRKNEEYLRDHPPGSSPVGDWVRERMNNVLGTGGGGGAPPTAGPPAEVARRTHDFWRSQGFTEEQVAGILAGGPGAESGFNPSSVGDNGTSYGLYQHHAERWAAMQKRYGTKYPTEAQQNEFAAWEISPAGPLADVGRQLRATRTSQDAALVWTGGFEKPADPGAGMKRGRNAARYIGLYDAGPAAGTGGTPGNPGPPMRVRPDAALTPGPAARSQWGVTAAATAEAPPASAAASKTVTIGTINVHTQAKDAPGIARSIGAALSNELTTQANRGLD